ncbi:MAG: hypothetical protein JW908_00670 [Anaerolineales bacterium]|nr:hypothetical protein [Anaerolineales bacterium]
MATMPAFTDIDTVRRKLKRAYRKLKKHGGWRAVGDEFGISGAMAFRIAERDYEPKNPTIRSKLGLPAYTEVPVCPVCGEVHIKKSCPKLREKKVTMRETELAEHVVDWLQSQHWTIYQEVELLYGGIADIVAERHGILWIVETKTAMSISVLNQASRWPVHYRSIAVPKAKNDYKRDYQLAKSYYGVGVITVDREYVDEIIRPPLYLNHNKMAKILLSRLTEEHKTYSKAGCSNGRRLTPYKMTMMDVKQFVTQHPGCTIQDIFDTHGRMHYASKASFKGNLLKALEDFERDWCRVDKTTKPFRLYNR